MPRYLLFSGLSFYPPLNYCLIARLLLDNMILFNVSQIIKRWVFPHTPSGQPLNLNDFERIVEYIDIGPYLILLSFLSPIIVVFFKLMVLVAPEKISLTMKKKGLLQNARNFTTLISLCIVKYLEDNTLKRCYTILNSQFLLQEIFWKFVTN